MFSVLFLYRVCLKTVMYFMMTRAVTSQTPGIYLLICVELMVMFSAENKH